MPSYSIYLNKTLPNKDLYLEIQELYLIEKWCGAPELVVVSNATTTRNENHTHDVDKSVIIMFDSSKNLSPESIKMTHHFVQDEKELSSTREKYKDAQCIYSKLNNIKGLKNKRISVDQIAYFSFSPTIRRADEPEIHITETPIASIGLPRAPAKSTWTNRQIAVSAGVALLGIFAGYQMLKQNPGEVVKKSFGLN